MIPKALNGCPNGTFNQTDKKLCCCSDTCCWNNCSTADTPPAKCLEGTDAFWMKDPRNGVWIAQKHKMNITTYASTGNDNSEAAANETNTDEKG